MATLGRLTTREKTRALCFLSERINRFFTTNINVINKANNTKSNSQFVENSVELDKNNSNQPDDIFGFESDIDSKIIEDKTSISPVEKYQHLFQKSISTLDEKVLVTTFGSVRLDSDNVLKHHGQYHETFEESISSQFPEHVEESLRRKKFIKYQNSTTSNETSFQQSDNLSDTDDTVFKQSTNFENKQQITGKIESNAHLINNPSSLQSYSSYTKLNNCNLDRDKITNDAHVKNSFIDTQYFSEKLDNTDEALKCNQNENNIDKEYFNAKNQKNIINLQKKENSEKLISEETNFIEDQYFNQNNTTDVNNLHIRKNSEKLEEINFIEDQYFSQNKDINKIQENSEGSSKLMDYSPTNSYTHPKYMQYNEESDVKNEINANSYENREVQSIKRSDFDSRNKQKYEKANIENPKTAYDYVMKLRKEEKEKNSTHLPQDEDSLEKDKDFKILKAEVQDFTKFPKDTIVTILKNSIIYNETITNYTISEDARFEKRDDIVAISKPYGLICEGESGENKSIDIKSCLPELAKRIMKKSADPRLYLIQPVAKNTTGVILLAKTEKMANYLASLLAENKIIKVYWVLTKGVPDLSEGVIDIPIAEGIINGKRRMVLKPEPVGDLKTLVKASKYAERAITHYNIISTVNNAALMEVKPETNVKHQIRVHLGFGLRCPILGDHKYSHLDKLAPQRLPDDMLKRLGVHQSKVRYLPMHLHLKNLVIPEILDGKNLFFKAPLPKYFVKNLQCLKIRKK